MTTNDELMNDMLTAIIHQCAIKSPCDFNDCCHSYCVMFGSHNYSKSIQWYTIERLIELGFVDNGNGPIGSITVPDVLFLAKVALIARNESIERNI